MCHICTGAESMCVTCMQVLRVSTCLRACMQVLKVSMCVTCVHALRVSTCVTYMQVLRELEDNIGSLGTGVTDSCELPYRCWELSLGSLQDQQVLLTAEQSLQP